MTFTAWTFSIIHCTLYFRTLSFPQSYSYINVELSLCEYIYLLILVWIIFVSKYFVIIPGCWLKQYLIFLRNYSKMIFIWCPLKIIPRKFCAYFSVIAIIKVFSNFCFKIICKGNGLLKKPKIYYWYKSWSFSNYWNVIK